jgi:hypothetical protein
MRVHLLSIYLEVNDNKMCTICIKTRGVVYKKSFSSGVIFNEKMQVHLLSIYL